MTSFTKKIGMNKFWNSKVESRNLKQGEERAICRVVGNATGVTRGTSQFGDYVGLTGMFEFTDLKTGEVTRSTTAYLPDVVMGFATPDQDEARKFAIDILAKFDEKSPVGFSYSFNPLIEAQDPLASMRDEIPALPDFSKKAK